MSRLSDAATVLATFVLLAACAASTAAERPIAVAVLPLHQASGEATYAPLAEAITDIIMARLAAAEGVVLVDRTAIDKVLKEQELSQMLSEAEQTRLGRIVGAKFVLTGSLTAAGEEFQLNAHLLEVSTARVARSAKAPARSDRLPQAVETLVQELAGGLTVKLPELTPDQIDRSPEANLHFMRGLGCHFAKLPEDAIVEHMKALAIDPHHARARFWLAMEYFDQGECDHAQVELTRFLRQFGQHELAPRAKELLDRCNAPPRQGETP